jgi:tetratricopeptide (TPR) repeat protein
VRAAARAALSLLVIVLLASPVSAGPSTAEREARHSFQAAEAHFRGGRFSEALAAYQAGYDKAPLPGFLINIAQCHRRLGDLRKARATYQKFMMVAPDSPHLPEVKTLISELDKLLADLNDETALPPSEEVATEAPVDPSAAAPSPAVTTSALVAAAPRPPADRPLLASTADPAGAPEPATHKSHWWLWTAVGVAVAGGAVAAFALTRSPETTTLHEGTLGTLRR